ncbi:MAG: inositol monophosphatase [Geminicoccaceae bacterium]|nr:inositol monophosphatase [Geminicoccaceae bacterium]
MTAIDERFREACRIAVAAGERALDRYENRGELTIESKGLQDFVSAADREVEDYIRGELSRLFPDDAILGEEGGGDEADRVWVIDPIDGTANFLRGIPAWGVLLAYVVDGVTEIGLTVLPVLNEVYAARRGHGATLNGRPIRISGCTEPTEACAAVSFSFKQTRDDITGTMGWLHDNGIDMRRIGSSAVILAWAAAGRVDIALIVSCNSWDCLPGLLLVEEAGGRATHYADGCSLLERRPVAACTPALAASLQARFAGLGLDAEAPAT